VAATTALVVSTDNAATNMDTVVYVRGMCRDTDTELGCNDDAGPNRKSSLVLNSVTPGTYFIIADTFDPMDTGHVQVTITPATAQGEACDPMAVPSPCLPGMVCRQLLPADPYTCELHGCEDTVDNDADGAIDYPFDSGCATTADDVEEILPGDPIPQCGDGLDNEGDTFIDYPADPGCVAASDTDELDCPSVTLIPITSNVTTGDTTTSSNDMSCSCGSECDFDNDISYAWTANTTLNFVRFDLAYDSFWGEVYALYILAGGCGPAAEQACTNITTGAGNLVFMNPVPGTSYIVVVDGGIGFDTVHTLTLSGEVAGGGACTPGDTSFPCAAGFTCDAMLHVCM